MAKCNQLTPLPFKGLTHFGVHNLPFEVEDNVRLIFAYFTSYIIIIDYLYITSRLTLLSYSDVGNVFTAASCVEKYITYTRCLAVLRPTGDSGLPFTAAKILR